MTNRRFGRSIDFLYSIMDQIEKKTIHSYNRHVNAVEAVSSPIRRDMAHDSNDYIHNRTLLVPHTISSSYDP